jgi:hypothetical protein
MLSWYTESITDVAGGYGSLAIICSSAILSISGSCFPRLLALVKIP